MSFSATAAPRHALILNRGSSSLRFSLFLLDPAPTRLWSGVIERLGTPRATLQWRIPPCGTPPQLIATHSLAEAFLDWLPQCAEFTTLAAIGHRVVHGMEHCDPERVSDSLLNDLRETLACDPEHAAGALELMESVRARFPERLQIACFDTAFHHSLPRVARLLPIPRQFESLGLRRYGFHGLSCESLLDSLGRLEDPHAAQGRLILAHLGSGCSMTAVHEGRSVDTTMGFTPAGGLPMTTRSGDLDPGVMLYLLRLEGMTEPRLRALLNHDSGLRGISESSADMRDLLQRESADPEAGEAIAYFCQAAKKQVGAYAAALGGLDEVVFSGGIGEHCHSIRSRICDGLQFLGIQLDSTLNDSNAGIISSDRSQVTVRVLPTDEELMIARSVRSQLSTAATGAEPHFQDQRSGRA